jgi:signal transduction histidine kinase
MFRNLTIRARLGLMAGIPLVLILLVSGLGFSVLQTIKINGAEYNKIISDKDLVADVLPPPEYIIESLLVVNQLADTTDAQDSTRLRLRLTSLEKEYNTRHVYWDKVLTDPQIRGYMLDQAYQPAQQFYSQVNGEFLPALDAGDRAEAKRLLPQLTANYDRHRTAIDQVVKLATAEQTKREEDVARTSTIRLGLLLTAMVLLILASAAIGWFTVRSIIQRIARLRSVATDDLPRAIEHVKAATLAGEAAPTMQPITFDTRDELTDAADAFNAVLGSAVDMASEQATLRRTTSAMFVNLGRRNHKLLSRTLSYITDLERTERDPNTLQNLFRLDHLTTRQRRNAESLLVLAGSAPLRTWSRPVPIGDVLRAALSEIESYDRVDIGQLEAVAVKGGAVSDVAHLLAELLENSTNFSSPQTRVRVLGRSEPAGYSLIVIDEGIGMGATELAAANQRIVSSASSDLDSSKMLGLGVVGRLAARHEVSVRLAEAPAGGLAVKVTLPPSALQAVTEEMIEGPAEEAATPEPSFPAPQAPVVPQAPSAQAPVPGTPPASAPWPPVAAPVAAPPVAAPVTAAPSVPPPAPAPEPVPTASAGEPTALPAWAADDRPAAAHRKASEAAANQNGQPGQTGLTRRVRGAQLPDTGPEATNEPAPERTAASVRNALSSFSAGRRTAGAASADRSPDRSSENSFRHYEPTQEKP